MSCPAKGCLNSQKTYWYHYNCGGRTKIRYEDLTVVCDKCPSSRHIIFDWVWNCGKHDFLQPDEQKVFNMLTVMASLPGSEKEL